VEEGGKWDKKMGIGIEVGEEGDRDASGEEGGYWYW